MSFVLDTKQGMEELIDDIGQAYECKYGKILGINTPLQDQLLNLCKIDIVEHGSPKYLQCIEHI